MKKLFLGLIVLLFIIAIVWVANTLISSKSSKPDTLAENEKVEVPIIETPENSAPIIPAEEAPLQSCYAQCLSFDEEWTGEKAGDECICGPKKTDSDL